MSSKPSDTGRFGFTAGGVDATNIAAPSSGLRDTGYPDNGIPTAKNFNYLENLAARWRVYLSDGAFQGATTFDSTVGIAGNTLIGSPLVVADFVFTADNTTDTCSKTAHGLLTGDGPIRVSNSGGALPAGLVVATDYWIIKVSADTFKFATTLINALNNAPINLTTNGTGTQTLSDTASTLRSANLTVDGNLTVGGVCPALTVTNLTAFGATITLLTASGITVTTGDYGHQSPFKMPISMGAFQRRSLSDIVTFTDNSGSGDIEGWGGWSPGDQIIAWVPLRAQDIVTAVTYRFDKNSSSAGMTFELLKHSVPLFGTALTTVVDTYTDTSSGAALINVTRTIASNGEVGNIIENGSFSIRVTSSTNAHFFLDATVSYTH